MKTGDSRRKRATPEREGPVRNPLAPGAQNSPAAGCTPSKEGDAAPAQTAPGDVFRETLECGVRTAYTVIDEYLRRGYEAARGVQSQWNGGARMPDDRPNFNTNWTNQWGPMSAPMQQWMTARRACTDAWFAMVPGWQQQAANMGWPGFPPAAAAPAISVQVSSHRPAEVTASISLSPGAESSMLTVGWLKGDGSNAHLKDVSIGCGPGSLRIGVPVPADQPSGRYCGEIKSADGRICGQLSVVIADLRRTPA
jgi:hypothetical protein